MRAYYQAAYRPGSNGIVERSHCTIKAMAERSGTRPVEAAYWYNIVPREGQREGLRRRGQYISMSTGNWAGKILWRGQRR